MTCVPFSWGFEHLSPLEASLSENSHANTLEIKNKYLSCLKPAQNLLISELDEEPSNQKDYKKLNHKVLKFLPKRKKETK